MRKLLLATSALVGAAALAAPAQAADMKLEVGGYADFRAGYVDENRAFDPTTGTALARRDHDFEQEVKVNFDAMGHGAGDLEYGARISFWNGADFTDGFNGGANAIKTDQAYAYMSGNWGKVILGDSHGASDLFVYAPSVGLEQVDGTYTDFTSNLTTTPFFPAYIDNEEDSTKITYYTPSVAGFQVGASYMPRFYDEGQNVVKYNNAGFPNSPANPYEDVLEVGAQYKGNFGRFATVLSGLITTGDASASFGSPIGGTAFQDFTAWGVGGQVGFGGFTVGGSYYDAGDFGAVTGQTENQTVWSAGGKYEWGRAAVGLSYLSGEGYQAVYPTLVGTSLSPNFAAVDINYIDQYQAIGLGGSYAWYPGLVTQADVVRFVQEGAVDSLDNRGTVVMISQRVNF